MITGFVVQPDALPSWHNLGAVLTDLTDAGERVPCMLTPRPFVSDEPEDRRAAAAWCVACPAVTACGAFADANAEPAHVWGGRDRTRRPYQRKESA